MTGKGGGLQTLLPVHKLQALTSFLDTACPKHRMVCQQNSRHALGTHIANQMMKCSQHLSVVSRIFRNHKQLLELKLLLKCTTLLQYIVKPKPLNACKNNVFDEQITHVYHLDMSLPKILVVNQFTIT